MASLRDYIFGGLTVLTLTVILNTDPAAAQNCAATSDCMNGGTCDDPGNAPCTCVNDWMGDTCADACAANTDCEASGGDGGVCETAATPKVCTCAVSGMEGPKCGLTTCTGTSCKNGGSCPTSGVLPCDCGSILYKGDTCEDECDAASDCEESPGDGATCDTSGATAVCSCADGTKEGPRCTMTTCTVSSCQNSGVCPTSGVLPCNCSATSYSGDTCEDACETDNDCMNGGTCVTSGSPNTCNCGDYKGDMCADDCASDGDCGTGGTCGTGTPKKCDCQDDGKEGPGCTMDKSGASRMATFSLMSVFVVLIGYFL